MLVRGPRVHEPYASRYRQEPSSKTNTIYQRRNQTMVNEEYENHIKVPAIDIQTSKDETGCGDQTMATLCAYFSKGQDIVDSINTAVVSGTLQFFKQGVQPIKEDELNDYLNKFRNQTE